MRELVIERILSYYSEVVGLEAAVGIPVSDLPLLSNDALLRTYHQCLVYADIDI